MQGYWKLAGSSKPGKIRGRLQRGGMFSRLYKRTKVKAIMPGEFVVFDDVVAILKQDDGNVARIEAINGECFAFKTKGRWVYASTIEVDSLDLFVSNPDAKLWDVPVAAVFPTLTSRLHWQPSDASPPGALPGPLRAR